jgi:ATP-binding cassette subfamily B multidrug efflux pump
MGIIFWGLVMVACALVAWVMNVWRTGMRQKLPVMSQRMSVMILFEHTLYLSCEKTDAYTIPSLESRLTSDTYNLHRMIGMMQRMGVRAPIITVGGLVLCFLLEPVLAWCSLASFRLCWSSSTSVRQRCTDVPEGPEGQ